MSEATPARVDGANAFMSSGDTGGRWAGEQLLKALKEGRKLSPKELRTLDTLPFNAWIEFDKVAVREGLVRSPLVTDLLAAGLRIPIPNAMGKTVFQWDRITNMTPAIVSLDGLARSDNDRTEFDHLGVPLPITHKDFNIGLRSLEASRDSGEPLDTLQVGLSGGLVGEKIEEMTIIGGPTYGGQTVYGLNNHPKRNTGGFGTNGNWAQVAKTGLDMFNDIRTAVAVLRTKRFYGPYWVLLPGAYGDVVDVDYSTLYPGVTINDRIMKIKGLQKIIIADQQPANTITVFQATRDVVAIADGEGIQTIQWDIYGGMAVAMKVFAIQVPVVRATAADRSGIYVIS